MENRTKDSEYDNFDRTMRELIKVSHSKIKAKLNEEKKRKSKKTKQSKQG
jgi:hypothetical protein